MNTFLQEIDHAGERGDLSSATVANLRAWLDPDAGLPSWVQASIGELVADGAWAELNDRFAQDLAFGTGGMRGRSIARLPTSVEQGAGGRSAGPGRPAAGSACMNDITIVRATVGVFRQIQIYLRQTGRPDDEKPRMVVACDVRHFSRHFAELVASTWVRLGGIAHLFDGPRSTPQLSFTVRYLEAHAGVMITASHNPPHDNGYKLYGHDGGQAVPPFINDVVATVEKIPLRDVACFLTKDTSDVATCDVAADQAYADAIDTTLTECGPRATRRVRIAFSSLHGTGGISAVPALRRAGFEVSEVESQRPFDPEFSTVESPNPEDPAALRAVIELAERERLDLALATDPDGDRVGVAAPDRSGKFHRLTGNQVGALLADFRLGQLKAAGLIPKTGSASVALITTVVTSPLLDAVGRAHGVKVVNTLTGFKWIGARIARYERAWLDACARVGSTPASLTFATRARALQLHDTFFAFGAEESCGYLPIDTVRDKDANAACLLLAELAATARMDGETLPERLDRLYLRHGYHLEDVAHLSYPGADGVERIARILESYRAAPPALIGNHAVTGIEDFGISPPTDADGETLPKQDLFMIHFADGSRCAIRGSGTEPKLKFYLFACEAVASPDDLSSARERTVRRLKSLARPLVADARARAAG